MRFLLALSFLFSINIFSNEVNDFKLRCSDSWYKYRGILNHESSPSNEFYLDYDSSNQVLIVITSMVGGKVFGEGDDVMYFYDLIEAGEKNIIFKKVLHKSKSLYEMRIPKNFNLHRASLELDIGKQDPMFQIRDRILCKKIFQTEIDSKLKEIKDFIIWRKDLKESQRKRKEEEEAINQI